MLLICRNPPVAVQVGRRSSPWLAAVAAVGRWRVGRPTRASWSPWSLWSRWAASLAGSREGDHQEGQGLQAANMWRQSVRLCPPQLASSSRFPTRRRCCSPARQFSSSTIQAPAQLRPTRTSAVGLVSLPAANKPLQSAGCLAGCRNCRRRRLQQQFQWHKERARCTSEAGVRPSNNFKPTSEKGRP